jgi:hypothetical protein
MFFKCKHPAKWLYVEKDHTERDSRDYPGEFTQITYHLYCLKCGEKVNISYSKPHWDVIEASIGGGVMS